MAFPKTLSDYPYVIVRLACAFCPKRRGRYRLARLVARYGAEADLDAVRRDLAKPCPRLAERGTQMRPGCHVSFPDLLGVERRAPDVPPG